MKFLIVIAKVLASVAVAALGYVMLDTARWVLLQQPLSLSIPAAFYEMRLERLWFGGTVLLLGVLCALSALKSAVLPESRRA